MHRRQFIGALAAFGATGITHAYEPGRVLLAQAQPARRSPDVVFVPTPGEVIDKMLDMAKVTP